MRIAGPCRRSKVAGERPLARLPLRYGPVTGPKQDELVGRERRWAMRQVKRVAVAVGSVFALVIAARAHIKF